MGNMVYYGLVKVYDKDLEDNVDVINVFGGEKINFVWIFEIDNDVFVGVLK